LRSLKTVVKGLRLLRADVLSATVKSGGLFREGLLSGQTNPGR